jgi:hypothetical protein
VKPSASWHLPQPDWLQHRLTVWGAAGEVAGFCRAAAGSGVVLWWQDHDRLAEDWFHLLLEAPPERRSISVAGARLLAGQLRDAVWEAHELALSHLGAHGCPFDLQALAPVPRGILRLGADDPASLAWLWRHWGTTWPLRRVEVLAPTEAELARCGQGDAVFCCGFWSADWTPWPVISGVRQRWPALLVVVAPVYDARSHAARQLLRDGGHSVREVGQIGTV